jgi:hypothetical protein
LWSSCQIDQQHDFEIKIKRLDTLYTANAQKSTFDEYAKAYGYFWDVYTQHVITLPKLHFQDSLVAFQQEYDFQKPYQHLQTTFSNFEPFKNEFSEAFYRYHQAFPDKVVPSIVTFFGGFNYVAIATDSTLGIGLEMFLGKNAEYYQKLTHKFPLYMHQQFQPDYMLPLALNGWLDAEFPAPTTDFLSQMIHYGKIKYAISHFMNDAQPHLIMGFSVEQMEWCLNNEFSIWKFLIEQGLLYSNDQFLISKYLRPAPNSRGMPSESPGQVAVWIGWNIVDKFMSNHKEYGLKELFQTPNAQFILNQSKYKP